MATKAATKPKAAKTKGHVRAQGIAPFLMFRKGGAEAVRTYVSLFKGAKLHSIKTQGKGKAERLLNAVFELDGRAYHAMDGGRNFAFSEGLSLMVTVRTQKELDALWNTLAKGGQESMCGWLTDRWGLSWQLVPEALSQMLTDPKNGNAEAVLRTMLATKGKLDVKALKTAYRQRAPTRRNSRRQTPRTPL